MGSEWGKKEILPAYVTSHNTPLVSASVSTQPSLCLLWRCHPDRPFLFWTQPCLRDSCWLRSFLFTFFSSSFLFLSLSPFSTFHRVYFCSNSERLEPLRQSRKVCTPSIFTCFNLRFFYFGSIPAQPSMQRGMCCARCRMVCDSRRSRNAIAYCNTLIATYYSTRTSGQQGQLLLRYFLNHSFASALDGDKKRECTFAEEKRFQE